MNRPFMKTRKASYIALLLVTLCAVSFLFLLGIILTIATTGDVPKEVVVLWLGMMCGALIALCLRYYFHED